MGVSTQTARWSPEYARWIAAYVCVAGMVSVQAQIVSRGRQARQPIIRSEVSRPRARKAVSIHPDGSTTSVAHEGTSSGDAPYSRPLLIRTATAPSRRKQRQSLDSPARNGDGTAESRNAEKGHAAPAAVAPPNATFPRDAAAKRAVARSASSSMRVNETAIVRRVGAASDEDDVEGASSRSVAAKSSSLGKTSGVARRHRRDASTLVRACVIIGADHLSSLDPAVAENQGDCAEEDMTGADLETLQQDLEALDLCTCAEFGYAVPAGNKTSRIGAHPVNFKFFKKAKREAAASDGETRSDAHRLAPILPPAHEAHHETRHEAHEAAPDPAPELAPAGKHWAVKGCLKDSSEGSPTQHLRGGHYEADVVCCTDFGDDVQCVSEIGFECLKDKTFEQAWHACKSEQMRLCTKREIESRVCCNGDCGFGKKFVWTSSGEDD